MKGFLLGKDASFTGGYLAINIRFTRIVGPCIVVLSFWRNAEQEWQ
jgi:hypothetical protein